MTYVVQTGAGEGKAKVILPHEQQKTNAQLNASFEPLVTLTCHLQDQLTLAQQDL